MKAIRITALVLMMIMSLSVFCACTTLDKTELEEVLNREFDPAGYTDSSYENYLKRYREALDVYQSQNTTAYHIESATVNLLDAIDALVPVADFSQLKAELAEEINPMLYTNASYQVYKTVYDSALIVASNELSKQSVVNNALRTLKTAKSALVLKTDTSALAALLETEYKKSDYTASSYVYYETAAEAAKAIVADDAATESDVRLAINGLQQAIGRLIPIGDFTKLLSLMQSVQKQYLDDTTSELLPEQRYTKATLDVLRNEYQTANERIASHDASQVEVDTLYECLFTAANKLVDKVSLYNAILTMDGHLALQSKYTTASFDKYLLAVTKGMLLNEEYDPTAQQIADAVELIRAAENALVRKPLDASGRTDFDLGSMWVSCFDCGTRLDAYFNDYSVFYNLIFDSYYMVEQSSAATFRLQNGYSVSILADILTITDVGRTENDTKVSVLGITFDMDEYAVGEKLGAPTRYESTDSGIVLVYVDEYAGIVCEFNFSEGHLDNVMIHASK